MRKCAAPEGRIANHHNDIDDDGGDAQNEILHHLRLVRQDKLRKQGGQKNNAFGIGEIYEHRALKQFAARLRLRQRIQVDRPCRPPLLDTQPDQVGGAGLF